MLFHSYNYILLFLPLVIMLFFLVNSFVSDIMGRIILLLASMVFLSFANWYSVSALIISILVNYCLGRLLQTRNRKKSILIAGIVFNVAYLCGFKYYNFISDLFAQSTREAPTPVHIFLPVGISFYTFQQIAYLVDTYRDAGQSLSFADYALFGSFFPKLLQGPIVYRDELVPQFSDKERKAFSFSSFSAGLAVFAFGLGKKVLLADNFGIIVDYGFSHVSSLNAFEALLTILGYSLQIYFDFSGYCDMAAGAAKMLTYDLPANFDSPYKAKNIADFWKRWHITLTRFLTKYIYIPLGGNRKGTFHTCLNILIVFLISGLWHGTGVTFLLWGVMHGAASVLYRFTRRFYDRLLPPLQWMLNFGFVTVAWVFFRAPSASTALSLLQRLCAGAWRLSINEELSESLLMPFLINIPSQFIPLPIVILLAYTIVLVCTITMDNTNRVLHDFRYTPGTALLVYLVLTIGILSMSGVTSFLYINF